MLLAVNEEVERGGYGSLGPSCGCVARISKRSVGESLVKASRTPDGGWSGRRLPRE